MNKKELPVTLNDWESKILLELLQNEKNRLQGIMTSSNDDDEIADAGNELMEIDTLLERLTLLATEHFGESVLNFSREPL